LSEVFDAFDNLLSLRLSDVSKSSDELRENNLKLRIILDELSYNKKRNTENMELKLS